MAALPYVISKKAKLDIEQIWLYTFKQWSKAQADRYHVLLFDEIAYLCKNPTAGKSMSHIRDGYRASKVKSHLIFYRVQNNVLEVIRVLHERMDVENRLAD